MGDHKETNHKDDFASEREELEHYTQIAARVRRQMQSQAPQVPQPPASIYELVSWEYNRDEGEIKLHVHDVLHDIGAKFPDLVLRPNEQPMQPAVQAQRPTGQRASRAKICSGRSPMDLDRRYRPLYGVQ